MGTLDETFKGKVRRILANGKRVLVARSHSVCEISNQIPSLKVGDIVLCAQDRTLQKIDPKQG